MSDKTPKAGEIWYTTTDEIFRIDNVIGPPTCYLGSAFVLGYGWNPCAAIRSQLVRLATPADIATAVIPEANNAAAQPDATGDNVIFEGYAITDGDEVFMLGGEAMVIKSAERAEEKIANLETWAHLKNKKFRVARVKLVEVTT